MFYFVSWLILLCATTTEGIFDAIGDALGAGGDAISGATGIDIPVDDITDTLNYVKDIKDIVEDIDEVCGDIPVIKTVTDAIKTTADAVKTVADTIEDTTDTIKDYVDEIKDELPTVGDVVDGIKTVTDAIEDTVDTVKDTVNTVKNTATSTLNTATSTLNTATSTLSTVTDILENVERLTDLFENPLSVVDQSDDLKDLANTLAVCFEDMKGLVPSAVALDHILGVPDAILDLMPFDPTDIFFVALAGSLLPIKSQVEYACFDGVPLVVSVAEEFFGYVPSANDTEGQTEQRRLSEDNDCQKESYFVDGFDGFCIETEPVYPYDSAKSHKDMVKFLSGLRIMENSAEGGRDWVHADELQKLRFLADVYGHISSLVDDIVEFAIDCAGVSFGEEYGTVCFASGFGRLMAYLARILVRIFDYVIETAEYHDSNIQAARIDAILADRKGIISNQLRLRDILKTADDDRQSKFETANDDRQSKFDTLESDIDGLQKTVDDKFNKTSTAIATLQKTVDDKFNKTLTAIATLQGTVDSLPNLNGASNGNGNGNGGKANAEFGEIMDGVDEKTVDEGLIIIKIKPSDLYIVGAFIIGFIAVFIGMTVGLILKVCNGNNSGYGRAVKYDTEPDIEQK